MLQLAGPEPHAQACGPVVGGVEEGNPTEQRDHTQSILSTYCGFWGTADLCPSDGFSPQQDRGPLRTPTSTGRAWAQ